MLSSGEGGCTAFKSDSTDMLGKTVTCGDGPNCNNIGPKSQGGRGLTCWDPSMNTKAKEPCREDQWQCSVSELIV